MDDVVIVGGGIIGASTAYFLSKAGRKSFLSGRIKKNSLGSASSPKTGVI